MQKLKETLFDVSIISLGFLFLGSEKLISILKKK
jgi:hypothetical protein